MRNPENAVVALLTHALPCPVLLLCPRLSRLSFFLSFPINACPVTIISSQVNSSKKKYGQDGGERSLEGKQKRKTTKTTNIYIRKYQVTSTHLPMYYLVPHRPLPAPAHDEHLEALDAVPQRRVLLGQRPVPPLQQRDVLGRLAEDGGLVELVRGGEAAEVVLGVQARLGLDLLHDVVAAAVGVLLGVLEAVDHDPQRGHGVAEGGDLVVEVGPVSLLDHVVCSFLGALGGLVVAV